MHIGQCYIISVKALCPAHIPSLTHIPLFRHFHLDFALGEIVMQFIEIGNFSKWSFSNVIQTNQTKGFKQRLVQIHDECDLIHVTLRSVARYKMRLIGLCGYSCINKIIAQKANHRKCSVIDQHNLQKVKRESDYFNVPFEQHL